MTDTPNTGFANIGRHGVWQHFQKMGGLEVSPSFDMPESDHDTMSNEQSIFDWRRQPGLTFKAVILPEPGVELTKHMRKFQSIPLCQINTGTR